MNSVLTLESQLDPHVDMARKGHDLVVDLVVLG